MGRWFFIFVATFAVASATEFASVRPALAITANSWTTPRNYNGVCPAAITLNGMISGGIPGAVRYVFRYLDPSTNKIVTVGPFSEMLDSAGTAQVSARVSWLSAQAGASSVTLVAVQGTSEASSTSTPFSVACTLRNSPLNAPSGPYSAVSSNRIQKYAPNRVYKVTPILQVMDSIVHFECPGQTPQTFWMNSGTRWIGHFNYTPAVPAEISLSNNVVASNPDNFAGPSCEGAPNESSWMRAVIRYNLSSLPASVNVWKATLHFQVHETQYSEDSSTSSFPPARFFSNLSCPARIGTGTSNSWESSLPTMSGWPAANFFNSVPFLGAQFDVDVTPQVTAWYHGAGNFGFVLADAADKEQPRMTNSRCVTSFENPILTILYTQL